jgi:hypothetical protein
MKKAEMTPEVRDAAALEIVRLIVSRRKARRQAESIDRNLNLIAREVIVFADICDDNIFIAEVLTGLKLIPEDMEECVSSSDHAATWNAVVERLSWAAGEVLKEREAKA